MSCARNSKVYLPEEVKEPLKSEVVDVEKILESKNLNGRRKAEKVMATAEKLITPIGFMYANKIINQALELDPTNQKALLYKGLISPAMEIRGIFKRIQPMIEKMPLEKRKKFDRYISSFAPGGLRQFLFDGTPDIDSEEKVQALLMKIYQSYENFRIFLKNNKGLFLRLELNFSERGIERECSVSEVREGVYKFGKCSLIRSESRNINRTEIEVLQHAVAGVQIYIMLSTAYNLNQGLGFLNHVNSDPQLSERDFFDYFSKIQKLGELKADHHLAEFKSLGSDAYSGARWAYRMQSEICKEGKHTELNREGYLFNQGVCLGPNLKDGTPIESLFEMIELALMGTPQNYAFKRTAGEYANPVAKASFNPFEIFNNPVKDLKSLFPQQYDQCGRVLEILDPSAGGLFPDGDFHSVYEKMRTSLGASCEH